MFDCMFAHTCYYHKRKAKHTNMQFISYWLKYVKHAQRGHIKHVPVCLMFRILNSLVLYRCYSREKDVSVTTTRKGKRKRWLTWLMEQTGLLSRRTKEKVVEGQPKPKKTSLYPKIYTYLSFVHESILGSDSISLIVTAVQMDCKFVCKFLLLWCCDP